MLFRKGGRIVPAEPTNEVACARSRIRRYRDPFLCREHWLRGRLRPADEV